MPAVRLTWYDGGLKPRRPDELEANQALPEEGLMFIGDRGTILCGFSGRRPRLIPETKKGSFKEPPQTLARSPGNLREWLDACKGASSKPGASFEFSGPVAEALALGNVAVRTGQRIIWDAANLKAAGAGVEKCIHPERRPGWNL